MTTKFSQYSVKKLITIVNSDSVTHAYIKTSITITTAHRTLRNCILSIDLTFGFNSTTFTFVIPMKGHDWINTCLPDELIVEIFRRLDSKPTRDAASLVCNRWLRLERLTRSSIRIGATGSPDLFVQLLASRFFNITAVHIDERLSISLPVQLGRRRENSSPASSLKLHYVNKRIGSSSSSEENEFDSLCLSDNGLVALADGFPKLEKLKLIWCSNVTSFGLSSLASKCASLKSLDLQVFAFS